VYQTFGRHTPIQALPGAQGPQHSGAPTQAAARCGPRGAASGVGTGRCRQGRAADQKPCPQAGAAGSRRRRQPPGLDEILTVIRLGLPAELRSSLACTNIIEKMMGTIRCVCRNVKHWQDASMSLRWTSAAMLEAAKGFRRLKATSSSRHCGWLWPPTRPNMPPTAPLNRLLRRRNLLNRLCLPSKFQQ
jgi:hypothetical protein